MTNEVLMGSLPYFVFVMYLINRGTAFTQALFMNCDHSMLSYSFYKKPAFILKLFRIRLWEIMKVNLLPASVIGLGLPLLLYCSGGTDRPLDYVLLLVSILAMSIFFSVHYLVCYYPVSYTHLDVYKRQLLQWALIPLLLYRIKELNFYEGHSARQEHI